MDVATINKHLKKYGVNFHGDPLYRVVWSDDQLELRRGTFNEWYGHIFIREYTGVARVPKYSYLSKRWVLERWIPPSLAYNEELVESRQGSYEPLYVFEDKNGNPLPLALRPIELIISFLDRKEPPGHKRALIQEWIDNKERAADQFIEDALSPSPIQNALHMKEGIGYDRGLREMHDSINRPTQDE